MGFLRKGSIYRAPCRWYPGGPIGEIEFYEAAEDAEWYDKEHTFGPAGLFYSEKFPDGVGELTLPAKKRRYWSGVWDEKPPGLAHVGTESDFKGLTPYPGPSWPSELPVCPDALEPVTWSCTDHETFKPEEPAIPGDMPCVYLTKKGGWQAWTGEESEGLYNGEWFQLCGGVGYDWDHYPGLTSEKMVTYDLSLQEFPGEGWKFILLVSHEGEGLPWPNTVTYKGDLPENLADPITLTLFIGGVFEVEPESITLYPKVPCEGEDFLPGGGGSGPGGGGTPSVTPRTFKSSSWFMKPWFTPRWA